MIYANAFPAMAMGIILGAPPPTVTPPTCAVRVIRLGMEKLSMSLMKSRELKDDAY